MDRGVFVHEVMYNYHHTQDVEEAIAMATYPRPEGMLTQEERQKYDNLEAAAKYLARGYFREVKEEFKVKEVEVALAFQITEEDFYVGVLDGVAEIPALGDLVLEYKTTSQLPDKWVAKFQLDSQTVGYVVLGRANGRNLKGVILALLRATRYPDYVRDTILTEDWLIEEWKNDIRSEIEELRRRLSTLAPEEAPWLPFEKNTDSCTAYNHLCPFHKLCTERPSQRLQMMKEGFFKRREQRELRILQKIKEADATHHE